MANYVFETMTSAQAAGFGAGDFLVFTSSSTSATTLHVTPNEAAGLFAGSINLSDGTQDLAFPSDSLSQASTAGHLIFNDQSNLVLLGTDSIGETFAGTTANDVIYGFAADDTISGANGDDYIYGGTGADSLLGNNGNDHIYGNALGVAQGSTDGGDSIAAGDGVDYVNGNGGDDRIDGGAGRDHLLGGNGADTIFGGDGNDTINGNLGADSILGENGNDYIRGGQDGDSLSGGNGDDIIRGDAGADSISGGQGYDVLEGGSGTDVDRFVFAAADSTAATSGHFTVDSNGQYDTGSGTTASDVITDFVHGTDKIDLAITSATVVYQTTGSSYSTMAAAQLGAVGLLAGTTNTVAAVNVGSDTYLFFDGDGSSGTIDSVVKLLGVSASSTTLTASDFV